jgi:hypothetical protein
MQLDRRVALRSARALSKAQRHTPRAGVATVEAVIMLPVLGMLLVGTLFLHRLYSAHEKALIFARRCAFEYAVNGCTQVPVSCLEQPTADQTEEGKQRSNEIVSNARPREDHRFDVLSDVPVIGNAIDSLFGTTARGSAAMAVAMPWPDGPSVQGSVQISLACNERDHDDVVHEIEQVFCKYLPVLDCKRRAP